MNGILKRLGALLLALSMFTMSACAGTAPDGDKPAADANVAMGRYIETERTLPEKLGYVHAFMQRADGSIELFGNLDPEKNVGPWKIFTSVDGGKSWAEKDAPWLSRIDDAAFGMVTTDKDENWYFRYTDISPEIMAMLERGETPPDDYNPEEVFLKIDPSGTVTELESELPRGSKSAGSQSILIPDNGDFIINDYGSILQVDPETREIKNEFIPEFGNSRASYITYDNTLVISDGDNIVFFDLTTGEKTSSLSFVDKGDKTDSTLVAHGPAPTRVFAVGKDNSLYIGDHTGIYRHVENGAVFEKLVDGEMTSLNMPSMRLNYMALDEKGDPLVFYSAGDVTGASGESNKLLLSYSYSDTTPTVPDEELKIYSLYDNKNIRQAMGLFQRQNPDTHVIYTVGMEGGGAVISDALRTLSTELLAGKGPDLLVLDGMPIDSYIEKGVLLDLSETVNAKVAAGEWLENVSRSFLRDDGKTYALPARFSVPMVFGTEDSVAAAASLSAFADYLTKHTAERPDKTKAVMPGDNLSAYGLLTRFYPLSAPAWQADDGTIKEDAFRAFLTDLKRLYDTVEHADKSVGDPAMFLTTAGGFWSAVEWAFGKFTVFFDEMVTLADAALPDAAIKHRGEGTLDLLGGQVSGVFLPKTVLGVNANSTARDAALAFLHLTLSEAVQNNDFEDGIPINAASFAQGLQDPYAEFDDGVTYGTTTEDGENLMLNFKWPADDYMQAISAKLKALDTPFVTDLVVEQLLVAECTDFFKGEKSLDDTVTAFTTKYNLYLSE